MCVNICTHTILLQRAAHCSFLLSSSGSCKVINGRDVLRKPPHKGNSLKLISDSMQVFHFHTCTDMEKWISFSICLFCTYGSELMSCVSDCCILFCSPVHQTFLRWVFCGGYRGQPSSLHIHHTSSYMIYNVYTNALYMNEDMPCGVKRPFSSIHTQTNYCQQIRLTLSSITSKGSLNPQTRCRTSPSALPTSSPSGVSVPNVWSCCSHSADDLFELQQIPVFLNLPSFKVQGPFWKTTALWNEGTKFGGEKECCRGN